MGNSAHFPAAAFFTIASNVSRPLKRVSMGSWRFAAAGSSAPEDRNMAGKRERPPRRRQDRLVGCFILPN
jgi:hypothetical protein